MKKCDECKRPFKNGVYLPDEKKELCVECVQKLIEKKKSGK